MASQSKMTTMSTIQGHSAFFGLKADHQAAPDGGPVGLTIKEMTHQGKINIRCGKSFHKKLSKITGIETDLGNNRCASTKSRHALWLSPDEVLLLTEAGAEQALAKQIQDSAGNLSVAVNDITDALTSLHLSGHALRDVLAKGCPLDLHKDHFKQGDCAQSTLSHAGVTLCAVGAEEMIVICRTSFTDYVVSYLCDAALEYGYDLKI
ncbi:MAG: sarcosine oxidase subunit gamma [Candidatus Puniceispirillaceae bacterium]